MLNKTKHPNISFWLLTTFSISATALLSNGFIRNLYFFMEDHLNFYLYRTGSLRPWPYETLSKLLYPMYEAFSNNTESHFTTVLLLYIILCLTLTFFVWEITNNKWVAFLSGLLLAAGGTGSQMLFMVESGWNGLYLILSLLTILVYNRYLKSRKPIFYLVSLGIFTLSLWMLPYRSFTFIFLIFLTSFFDEYSSLKNRIINTVKDLLPFILVHLLFFASSGGGSFMAMIRNYEAPYILNLLADIGNFVIPSTVTQSLSLQSFLGFIFTLTVLILSFSSRINSEIKRNIAYLFLCFLTSYIFFHLREPHLYHESWSRYIMHAYPLYITLIAYLCTKVFIQENKSKYKNTGYAILATLILINLYASFSSPLKAKMLDRGFYFKKFTTSITEFVPNLGRDGKYLFYFDVAQDGSTLPLFTSFFATGSGTEEMVLANIYELNVDNLKITYDPKEFNDKELKNNYSKVFSFSYNKDRQLKITNLK